MANKFYLCKRIDLAYYKIHIDLVLDCLGVSFVRKNYKLTTERLKRSMQTVWNKMVEPHYFYRASHGLFTFNTFFRYRTTIKTLFKNLPSTTYWDDVEALLGVCGVLEKLKKDIKSWDLNRSMLKGTTSSLSCDDLVFNLGILSNYKQTNLLPQCGWTRQQFIVELDLVESDRQVILQLRYNISCYNLLNNVQISYIYPYGGYHKLDSGICSHVQ